MFNAKCSGPSLAGRSQVLFETREHKGQKVIFIDGLLFDFDIDEDSLKEAKRFCGDDLLLKKAVHGDIKRVFLESLSKVLGRPISIKQVNEAIISGSI